MGEKGRATERKRKREIHFSVICLVLSSYGTLAWFLLLCQVSSFSPFTLFFLALSPSPTFLIHLLLQPLLYFAPTLNSLCAPHSNTCSQPCFPTVFPSLLLWPPLFLSPNVLLSPHSIPTSSLLYPFINLCSSATVSSKNINCINTGHWNH